MLSSTKKLFSSSRPGGDISGILLTGLKTNAARVLGHLVVGGTLLCAPTMARAFSDGFEGSTFDPFWTVNPYYGTASLSTTVARTGTQSLKLSSLSGSPTYTKGAQLYHTFAQPISRAYCSVWLYDTSPGQQTNYALLGTLTGGTSGFPGGTGSGVSEIGVVDQYANYYSNGGSSTAVARTLGWHHLELISTATVHTQLVDGVVVGSQNSTATFDTIYLDLEAPYWRPNATFYFDDFQMTVNATPEPSTLLALFSTVGLFGLAIFRRNRA